MDTRAWEARSRIIYTATVGTPGDKLWDNKQVQRARGAMNAYELIERMFGTGEKDAIINRIEAISGSGADLVDPLSD